jgi:hypothetical protein
MSGCFLSFLNQTKKSFAGTVRAILFYALAFLTGTEGIRIFYNFLLPLALTVFATAYFNVTKEKKTAYQAAFMAILFSFSGYLVNVWFLKNIFSFHRYDYISLDGFGTGFFDKFSGILFNIYAAFWGYTSAPVLHIDGFLSIVSLLFFALSIAGFAFLLKNTFAGSKKTFFTEMCRTGSSGYFLLLYTAVSLIFNFIFFLFINGGIVPRYFFAALIFLFAALPVFMVRFVRIKYGLVHSFLWIAVFVLLFGHGALIFHKNTRPYANENANRSGYLSFLERNSLSYGFASFWNANVTTELCNGRVEMVTLSDASGNAGRELLRYKWLSPAKFDSPCYHRGEAFLLLSKDEWETRKERAVFAEKNPAYQDDFFVVFIYPEAAVIHREIMGETF